MRASFTFGGANGTHMDLTELQQQVLQALDKAEPASLTELARETNLDIAEVKQVVQALIDKELISEAMINLGNNETPYGGSGESGNEHSHE